jgi:NADPH:quinone reductase-like Zn-dependent oxidoreductase
MLVYGLLSGEPLSLSGAELVFRTLTISGFWLKHWLETMPAGTRDAAFAQVIGHVAAGRIRLPVAARYDLEQAAEAAQAAVSSGRQGKVILTG